MRNTVKGNIAAAQASAADLDNTQLTAQAELAVDYFELRSQDQLIALTNATVKAYSESLDYNRAQYETGIGSDEAVAQAQVQLQTTQAQATNLGIARAQYEHAIAVLVGQPASTFSVPRSHRPCCRRRFRWACPPSCLSGGPMSRPMSGSWPRPMPRSAWPRLPTFPHLP